MSVQEIKDQIAALPPEAQNELMAFLFHLRHSADGEYQARIGSRLADTSRAHWLSPDEFERQLDQR